MEIIIRKYVLIILTVLLACSDASAQKWIPFDEAKIGKEYSVSIIESNLTRYKAKFTIHGLYEREIVCNNAIYHQLFMNNGFSTHEIGSPQLPTIGQMIAIPEGATYNVTVLEEKWEDIEVERIYPSQEDNMEQESESRFVVNDNIYLQDEYNPTLLCIGLEQNWRHIRNNNITLCPFKYYPTRNKLSVMTEFVLQVDFSNASSQSDIVKDDLVKAISWKMFANDISDFPIRKENESKTATSSDAYDYLIIVGNLSSIQNSQAMSKFRLWKALKGYKTKVVSTVDICESTYLNNTSVIKSYINQQFQNGVRYVLLIGDYSNILPISASTPNDNGVIGDYKYGCLGGTFDYVADMSIGRFSTTSLSEFENMVNKTISYEKSFDGNYSKILLVAYNETYPEDFKGCCESIRTYSYPLSLTFSTAYGADGATNSQVVGNINTGMHIVNYRGHGAYDRWGTGAGWNSLGEEFMASQISNISKTSIYFNACCNNGNISEDPCFMESFTRSSNGAVACIAANDVSKPAAGSLYDKQLFIKLYENSIWHIGDLNIGSHLYGFPNNDAIRNAFVYIVGADPTLEIWTGTPNYFSNVSVSMSGSNMTISSPSFHSGDSVSVVSEAGELLAKYYVSGNSCSFTVPYGNFYFAVNRHNYYPYITYCSFDSYIQNKTIDVNSYYSKSPMSIGYSVTTEVPYGNVTVESGNKLTIKNGYAGVEIPSGFECKAGAELVIE